ncbi:MAG: GntG family PLP-dependent aldolase, partial [Candidatus Electryoneaceae bacterium]|nr:GntG family PLP-dependent aldolase [Candidatus Electryoneaceae bacterium]
MRQAMFDAQVGDDVFGDDPTVSQLQQRVAEILNKEAALYLPSGTMANQVAMASHTSPGDEIYCEINCHVLNYEAGAPAMLSGVMLSAISGELGVFTAEQVKERLRPLDHHFAPSRLIWVENSANRSGGCIFPLDECWRLRRLADKNGLKMHLDGARIWNVAVATGLSEADLAAPFDSVSVCLSKGLGAPVGSLVAGSMEFIDTAHRFRKRFGGGMRQAGVIAAAGLYSVEHNRGRLVDDHRRAKTLAHAIAKLPAFKIDLDAVHTNIIIFDASPIGLTGIEVADRLKEEGVLVTHFGKKVRMVTHLDISDDDVDCAIQALRLCFS